MGVQPKTPMERVWWIHICTRTQIYIYMYIINYIICMCIYLLLLLSLLVIKYIYIYIVRICIYRTVYFFLPKPPAWSTLKVVGTN